MDLPSLVMVVRAMQVSLRRECYKHTVVVEVCKCLDPVVGEKRIYELVWQLTVLYIYIYERTKTMKIVKL